MNGDTMTLDELNEAIAAKRGITWRESPCQREHHEILLEDYWCYTCHKGMEFTLPPDYSRDIAAAWPLAEEARLTVSPIEGGWHARQDALNYDSTASNGTNAAEAIARAWLKAKG